MFSDIFIFVYNHVLIGELCYSQYVKLYWRLQSLYSHSRLDVQDCSCKDAATVENSSTTIRLQGCA